MTLTAVSRIFPGGSERKLCGLETDELANLVAVLRALPSPRKRFAPEATAMVRSTLGAHGWKTKFRFGDFPELGGTQAAVTLDAARDWRETPCGHHHRFLLEICTDNRQAILLNLAKLEFGARRFEDHGEQRIALPIMLTVTRDHKERLKQTAPIDSAIGPFEEYVAQANGPWRGLITHQIQAIIIG
jgi:hypothetical protein